MIYTTMEEGEARAPYSHTRTAGIQGPTYRFTVAHIHTRIHSTRYVSWSDTHAHILAESRATDVDFPGSESDDLRSAARAAHVEGRTNGDARGRQSATCAAVGAERATAFRRGFDRSLLNAWAGAGYQSYFLRDRSGGHRVSPVGDSGPAGILDPRSEMQGRERRERQAFRIGFDRRS